ncbi:MAG: hypothetical protein PHO62_05895 [Sulfurimonas sp.]|uniref:hypothetical protein n=1 Tax=Sulfurimonas sp. TaxID=2022749 RepID=UPI0026071D47|nr:hypothetical protein [Sulfurimonas sp.]MDD5372939.1 hypothetical protein [Sulfurimonas sp.]
MVKVAVLHEGNAQKTNDNELLKLLIQDLSFDLDRVEFFGFGAKSNFFKLDNPKYERLKLQIEEEAISKILFVVDADYEKNDKTYGGFNNTENELRDIITKLSFSEIADIYVTCDPQTKDGYLESLLLSSIPKKQKECIETFLNCSEFASKENHKSVLNEIYKKAYPNAPYDFSHPNFDELKQKLHNLFK